MYCEECGTGLRSDATYCPECGTPVDGTGSGQEGRGGDGDEDPGDAPTGDGGSDGASMTWSPREEESPDGRVDDSRRARLPYPETTPPLLRGAIAGVVAYVVGYLVVVATMAVGRAIDPGSALAQLPIHSPDRPMAGWLFSNAHNVVISGSSDVSGSVSANFIGPFVTSLPLEVLYLVPPVVLGLVGAAFGWWILSKRRDQRGWVSAKDGAAVGATLTTGYVATSAATALTVFASTGDSAAAPNLVATVGVMGIAYPLVFGTLGGALVGAVMGA